MTTVSDLTIAVAFEMLQYCQFIRESQYTGITTGNNPSATAFFTTTLKLSGSTPDDLKAFFREAYGPLGELLAYINTHGVDTPVARLALGFTKYMTCCPNAAFSYAVQMGKYANDPIYAPLAKYFAMLTGQGPRPRSILPSIPTFTEMEIPVEAENLINYRRFILDGDSVLLIQGGEAGQFTVPPSLANCRMYVTGVSRNFSPGIDHDDNGLNNMTLTYVGEAGRISTGGIINFKRVVLSGEKNTPTTLRLHGHIEYSEDTNFWSGLYDDAGFDGSIYLCAMSRLMPTFGWTEAFNRINPAWIRMINDCDMITPAARGILRNCTGAGIMSPTVMWNIASNESYQQNQEIEGKRYMARTLSIMYALLVMTLVCEYYNQ